MTKDLAYKLYTIMVVHNRRHGILGCQIAWHMESKIERSNQLHHAAIHDTDLNRQAYPLLIDSMLNIMPVSRVYHEKYRNYGKRPVIWANRVHDFLERHPRIAYYVNKGEWVGVMAAQVWVTRKLRNRKKPKLWR